MKKPTQRELNPFKYSDSNKRYYTFDYYLKNRFGEKCAKISLDAGFTCPNIDGKKGYGGCIYCLSGSSGAQGTGTLREQYEKGVETVLKKWNCKSFIPYLQAHTNTYAPVSELRKIYEEAASLKGAVLLAIATRADCLEAEAVELIREISEKIPVLVELGLQSSNEKTCELINRCHTAKEFEEGYARLRNAGGDISVCIHLINGLPGESEEDMLNSARYVAKLHPDMIKLHMLYVSKGTPLCRMYGRGEYTPMELEGYVKTVVKQLELIPEDIVVARITGDGDRETLVAPLWSVKKTCVANEIDKYMLTLSTWQGKKT